MAEFYTVITNAGREAVARATQAGEKVDITHFAVGDGGGVPVTPSEEQTQLVNECWRGLVSTYKQEGTNIIIDTYIPSEEESFTAREMGIFTADGVLFAVCNTPEMRKVLPSEGAVGDFAFGMKIDVSNLDTSYIEIHTNPQLDFIKNSEKGQPNGVAPLGKDGKIDTEYLPEIDVFKIGDVIQSARDIETLSDGSFIKCNGRTVLEDSYPNATEFLKVFISNLNQTKNIDTIYNISNQDYDATYNFYSMPMCGINNNLIFWFDNAKIITHDIDTDETKIISNSVLGQYYKNIFTLKDRIFVFQSGIEVSATVVYVYEITRNGLVNKGKITVVNQRASSAEFIPSTMVFGENDIKIYLVIDNVYYFITYTLDDNITSEMMDNIIYDNSARGVVLNNNLYVGYTSTEVKKYPLGINVSGEDATEEAKKIDSFDSLYRTGVFNIQSDHKKIFYDFDNTYIYIYDISQANILTKKLSSTSGYTTTIKSQPFVVKNTAFLYSMTLNDKLSTRSYIQRMHEYYLDTDMEGYKDFSGSEAFNQTFPIKIFGTNNDNMIIPYVILTGWTTYGSGQQSDFTAYNVKLGYSKYSGRKLQIPNISSIDKVSSFMKVR